MVIGIPLLKFQLRGVEMKLHGAGQDSPRKTLSVDYELIIDTEEDDRRRPASRQRPEVRHHSNTVAAAARLEGTIRKKQ